MSADNLPPRDTVRVISMLKMDDGTVIDAAELSQEQREAYIEFAIHLAAPKLAKLISQGFVEPIFKPETEESFSVKDAYFKYPVMLTVEQAAEILNVSTSTIRTMERRRNGKFFPAVRMGNLIRIPRDELIQWIKDGGINKYHEEIKQADEESEKQKYRYSSTTRTRRISPKR